MHYNKRTLLVAITCSVALYALWQMRPKGHFVRSTDVVQRPAPQMPGGIVDVGRGLDSRRSEATSPSKETPRPPSTATLRSPPPGLLGEGIDGANRPWQTLDSGSSLDAIQAGMTAVSAARLSITPALREIAYAPGRNWVKERPYESPDSTMIVRHKDGVKAYAVVYRDELPEYFELLDAQMRLLALPAYREHKEERARELRRALRQSHPPLR